MPRIVTAWLSILIYTGRIVSPLISSENNEEQYFALSMRFTLFIYCSDMLMLILHISYTEAQAGSKVMQTERVPYPVKLYLMRHKESLPIFTYKILNLLS